MKITKEKLKNALKKIGIIALSIASFLFGNFCTKLHNHGAGASNIGAELSDAREDNQRAEDGIKQAKQSVDVLGNSVEQLEQTTRDNKRIIEKIRARGTIKDD